MPAEECTEPGGTGKRGTDQESTGKDAQEREHGAGEAQKRGHETRRAQERGARARGAQEREAQERAHRESGHGAGEPQGLHRAPLQRTPQNTPAETQESRRPHNHLAQTWLKHWV